MRARQHRPLPCRRVRRGQAVTACALALAAAAAQAQTQIFVGTSEQSGALVLSNFASKDAPALLLSEPGAQARSDAAASRQPRAAGARHGSVEIDRIVDSVAARTAVSPQLIHAVIAAESNYEPTAVSNRGAIGLMQLLPSTARRFGAENPFDPAQNVAAGAAYLKWLKDFFADDMELVLAGYNAGEQAVLKAGRKVPPYAETRAYVEKVKATLRRSEPASL